jgi:multiple sugar transport system permease protein
MTTLTQDQVRQAERQALIAQVRRTSSRAMVYGCMGLLAFFFLFPIIFMIVASFKNDARVIADMTSVKAFLPNLRNLSLENYRTVYKEVDFNRFAFNSIFITLITVSTGLFVNSMAAYVLSRLQWLGRKLILGIIVSLIIIPLEAIAIPLMMQVNAMSTAGNLLVTLILCSLTGLLWVVIWQASESYFLGATPFGKPIERLLQAAVSLLVGLPFEILVVLMIKQTIDGGSWHESYHVLMLPFIAEPFSIFLFYQFFIGIPRDFDEAAYVDGASYFRIYWQVIVPLSRPVFATVAILKFLQFWSFYMWPLLVTREDAHKPLMLGMGYFQTLAPIRWGAIMAYASLVTIPVLIFFLLFQKWFVQSVSSSGVKG